MTAGVHIRIAVIEATQLAQLVDDFRDLVGAERDLEDPAVMRLTPSVYPDDVEASEDFHHATRDDLLDRRALDADVVRAALSDVRADLSTVSETEAMTEKDLRIPASEIDSWLRTLTALRLVIADRLGIAAEDDLQPDDPRHGVYDWLAYRLEVLIQAADELL